ncbi:MATE family efflux transporter [Butyribacter intestini]|mgnify:FL=1|uniref:MATE family efflux transporter n=1 Tax=Butyribacter intestini TaxID=1703332 RepID=A0AAW3JUD3_9FIRM|nr:MULTISPECIES: MATE family efflux transporter [Clostridia]KQC85391.1 MATE family efflux transporter [Butyribacter intestini]UYJ41185.1 MAG: MATE family efflux transporter [Lachnospiraceae bacterium]
MSSNNKTDFTQGSILKKLFWFMLPILGALILQAAYGAVDLLVVGKFGSTAGLSAVSTGSQVLNLVTFVVTQFAMGITVLIARYIGEKKTGQIGKVLGGGVVVFTIISIGLFIFMVCFARLISVLMQAPTEAVSLTTVYVRICGSGIFFIVAYNVLAAIFRGLGDSRSPLIFVFVACIVNIVGDMLLVAGLHMDAAGAALATVLAQAVSVVCAIVMLFRKKLPFSIAKSDFRLNKQCRKFLEIGLPLALQEFLTQLSFLALCAFVNRLGLEASSGYGVACKIVNFAMLIPSSLMQSMASFVSQNVGAGNKKRARQAMFTGIGIGAAFGCVVFCIVMFKGDVLAGCFSNDAAVIQKGFEYLKGFAPETILTAVLFSMIGYFNGNNKTLWVMIQGLTQTLLVRLPMAYIMSIQPNASLTNIGIAAPTSTVVGIVLNIIFFFSYE